MLAYFLIYSIPLLALILPISLNKNISNIGHLSFGILLILFIGTRYEIGGDWHRYIEIYDQYSIDVFINNTNILTFEQFDITDPIFDFFNSLSASLGGGILLVNILTAAIFILGLTLFCKKQLHSTLAYIILMPYCVFIIGMGFSRQSLALGFIFIALSNLSNKKKNSFIYYIIFIFLASLSHRSSSIMFALTPFLNKRFNAPLILGIIFFMPLIVISIYPISLFKDYLVHYIERQAYFSSGAIIRVALNLLPSLIFLFNYKKFTNDNRIQLFTVVSLFNIISFISVFFYSTFVDRLAFYFIPFQVIFYQAILFSFKDSLIRTYFTFSIVFLYVMIFFVWFSYATHKDFWIPYNSYLLL